jgi:drug/metabolite transporter, DME family
VRPAGVALAVGAAISMAVLIVLLKRFSARIDPMRVVVYLDGIASALLWPALVFPDYRLSGAYLGYLALLGVVLTGLTGILYVLALRWVPATTVGVLSYLEPVSAVVLAAVLLGQRLTTAVVVGGAAIVAAGVAVVVATPDPIAAAVEEPVPSGEPLRAKARA